MAKIYYIGDWAVLTGPVFAESPFNYGHKGLEIFNYGKWLKSAIESNGKHQVESVPSWDFYNMAPGDYEKILEDYDVIIFSDVEAKLFQLAPSFFERKNFGKEVLTFPDRIRLTIEAIKNGKSVMFLGGWLSFTGEVGKGGWGRTRISEILPVKCMDIEDLVESTEGFFSDFAPGWDDKFPGIDFSTLPPILGYNRTIPIPEHEVILKVKETGDPLLAYGNFGKGKVIAYTSDPAPHWGCNFVFWKHYNDFWLKCIDLLLK
jgi:uncharacterized membrane protein